MRILHVITSINRGGAENQLMSLVRLQRAAGHALRVAYLREEGEWRAEMEALGIEVSDLRMETFRIPQAAWRLRREIRDFEPEVVNAHLQPAELCSRLALLGTSSAELPLVITKHNLKVFAHLPGEAIVARWVARRASAIIAVSESVKALCDGNGCSAASGKIFTVKNAIDLSPYEPGNLGRAGALRREWGVRESEVLVGTVGRLLPVKAFHVLIRAFAAYQATSVGGAKLAVVGRGALLGELEGLSKSLGIADKVIFPGFREDIPAVMAAFDVFALTSESEAFGVVILEAMAAGKPVVATRAGGIPEIVVDGVTGKLVPCGDHEAAARALSFFDLPANRLAFGSAGRKRAHEDYSLERMFTETMAVYEGCRPPKR